MVGAPQQMGQPMSGQYMGNPAMAQGAPRIKAEPGLDSPTHATQQLYPTPASAADRAAMNLQNQYGQRAAASISAIQGSVGRQQQIQQQGQPQQMNMQQRQQAMQQQHQAPQPQQQFAANGQQNGQQRPSMTPEQYKAMLAHQQRMQAQNAQNTSVGNAQTDGAGDEGASYSLIKQVNANGEEVMGRIEIDEMIRDKIAAMGQRMEGGGLMLPLALATNSKKRQRKVTKSTSGMGQLDGGDSDDDDKNGLKNEELDEDAINSDLDDPEDELNGEDDEDGDNMGSIMLCMYDKVQRVKNKWKCVMKDGVLTVNGKDYVFHKANGEYEW
ncbi:transcription factor IIA, alpha/beta subunit [Bisporella sp. PMI_857]|nr:transcription factor IIA, alpha/beta subunit [Bisporella sp. PMI_857]